MDHRDQPGGDRRGQAVTLSGLHDGAKLGIDLGPAFAHGKIAPDAGMRFGGAAIMRDHQIEGGYRRRLSGIGGEGFGVKPVEAHECDPLRRGNGPDLKREAGQQRPEGGIVEHIGDAVICQRRGEKEGAIDQLAPEIAPDIRRQHGIGVENPSEGPKVL